MARSSKLYTPGQEGLFPLSRSKVELFQQCRRCFYLDRRLGISRPPGFPFSLNSAVDALLKKEFDVHRENATPHPLMTAAGIDAVPFQHPELETWRSNFKGIRIPHAASGFELFGAVDDIWQERGTGRLLVVDYKATAKDTEVSLDAEWQDGYKRQVEFYQWLLRQRGRQKAKTGGPIGSGFLCPDLDIDGEGDKGGIGELYCKNVVGDGVPDLDQTVPLFLAPDTGVTLVVALPPEECPDLLECGLPAPDKGL